MMNYQIILRLTNSRDHLLKLKVNLVMEDLLLREVELVKKVILYLLLLLLVGFNILMILIKNHWMKNICWIWVGSLKRASIPSDKQQLLIFSNLINYQRSLLQKKMPLLHLLLPLMFVKVKNKIFLEDTEISMKINCSNLLTWNFFSLCTC